MIRREKMTQRTKKSKTTKKKSKMTKKKRNQSNTLKRRLQMKKHSKESGNWWSGDPRGCPRS
jgi:hypothetical protein